jgi:predicted O-methyltransferase YrrM
LVASALMSRRRFREPMTPDSSVAFIRNFRWSGGRLKLTQAVNEIVWLLDIVQQERPRRVLEIGTGPGATLFLWSRAATPDALLITVDLCPLGAFGRYSATALLWRSFARAEQRIEVLFGQDSHAPRTVKTVELLLSGEPVDFLFIDGDHSYDGVRRDYEMYAPLVRPGGLVAFHDVAPRFSAGTGVPRFWDELKATHDTMEIVAPTEPSYGIGVVRVPFGNSRA